MTDTATLDPRTLAALERALAARGWVDAHWTDGARQFAARLTDALAESARARPLTPAATSAYSAALSDASAAWPRYHEAWASIAIVLVGRDLVRAAGEDGADPSALARAAGDLASAVEALAPRDRPASLKLHTVDRVVRAARRALVDARDRALGAEAARGFVVPCFDQLSHALTLFVAREAVAEPLVREAVLRADAAARRDRALAWAWTTAAERRALARRCLAEAAGAMAASLVPGLTTTTEDRDASLWLARTAARVLACAARVDDWFPEPAVDPAAAPTANATATATATEAPAPQDPKTPNDTATEATVAATKTQQTPKADDRSMTRPTTGVEATMTDPKNPLIKTLQTDATDAAWRTAGSQFVKLAREPLVGLLQRHLAPGDDSMRLKIAEFLETELGTALLTSILSVALSALPNSSGEVPQKLARELRVRAMADAGDVVADVLMGPLRQVISLYLQDVGPTLVATAPPALAEPAVRLNGHAATSAEREPASR